MSLEASNLAAPSPSGGPPIRVGLGGRSGVVRF
jgi:hypothetical protein